MTRKAATIASTTVVLLLAAACSGTGSAGSGASSGGGSSATLSAVGYSRCMRSHGVPNFPDPDSSGTLPKADPTQLGVSGAQLQASQQACRHVLPVSGGAINAG